MKYKKGFIFICLIICLFSIASVCASDVSEIGVASENQSEELSVEDVNDIGEANENEMLSSPTENEIIYGGTFKELSNTIKNSANELNLSKNYIFSAGDSNYNQGVVINKNITINGNGMIIDGNHLSRGFYISSNGVVLKNITFINCVIDNLDCSYGGAIYWEGYNGSLENCNFFNCFSRVTSSSQSAFSYGGTIYWNGDNGTLKDCKFINCSSSVSSSYTASYVGGSNYPSSYGGAIYWSGNGGNLVNSIFINCLSNSSSLVKSYSYGGAIYWNGSSGVLNNCSLINCSSISKTTGKSFYSYSYGGAICCDGSSGVLNNSSFINCSSESSSREPYTYGGAIYWSGDYGILNCSSFKTCYLSRYNSADSYGGSVYWDGINGLIINSNFSDCSVSLFSGSYDRFAGAVYWNGINGSIFYSIFDNCIASKGGAIYWRSGNGILKKCTFEKCSSKLISSSSTSNDNIYAGAVYWWGANGVVDENIFINCSSESSYSYSYGGAICWDGSSGVLANSSFIECTAKSNRISGDSGAYSYGGAVLFNGKSCLLKNCSFNKCTSESISRSSYTGSSNGGAVYWKAEKGIMDDCSFINCLASADAYYTKVYGGAVYWEGKTGVLKYCSFKSCESKSDHIYSMHTANSYGGAVYWQGIGGSIEYSKFQSCKSTCYDTSATNNAYSYGGALYWYGNEGSLQHSIFQSCSVSCQHYSHTKAGPSVYWNGINKLFFNCSFNGKYLNYGDQVVAVNKFNPQFEINIENIVIREYVTVSIDVIVANSGKLVLHQYNGTSENSMLEIPITTNKVILNFTNLTSGDYKIGLYYGGDDVFKSVNIEKTFSITKLKPTIRTSNISNLTADSSTYVKINLDTDAKGYVSLFIFGNEFIGNVNNGVCNIFVPNLWGGEGIFNIRYNGDDKYESISINGSYNISFKKSSIKLNVEDGYFGDLIYINPILDDYETGLIYLYVDSILKANLNIGESYTLKDLNAGTHEIKVIYPGDNYFRGSENTTNITIFKTNTIFNITTSDLIALDNITINLNFDKKASGKVKLDIDNKTYWSTVSNGKSKFVISNLKKGVYEYNIYYAGDDNCYSISKNDSFIINFNNLGINLSVKNIYYGEIAKLDYSLTYNITDYLSLYIDDYFLENVSTLHNEYFLYNLSAGKYNIKVIFNGNDYFDSCQKTVSLEVKKWDPTINLMAFAGQIGTVNIILNNDATGNITISVNGVIYKGNLTNGTFTFNPLNFTTYNKYFSINYTGDSKYKSQYVTKSCYPTGIPSYFTVNLTDICYGESIFIKPNIIGGTTGDITISVDGGSPKTIQIGDTYELTDLSVGQHRIYIHYWGDSYHAGYSETFYIMVHKANPVISVISSSNSGKIKVTMNINKGATGDLSFDFGNKSYSSSINTNGVANINLYNVLPGEYMLIINYSGDRNYNSTSINYVLNVSKWIPNISIYNTVYAGNNSIIIFNFNNDATGDVSLNISDYILNSTVLNGKVSFIIPNIKPSSYSYSLNYMGDLKYSSILKKSNVIVKLQIPIINFNLTNILWGDNLTFTPIITQGASGEFDVLFDGLFIGKFSVGETFNHRIIIGGIHEITLRYNGDEYFESIEIVKEVEIYKLNSTSSILGNIGPDNSASVYVTLNEDASGKVSVIINGTNYTSNLIGGVATFSISNLPAGTYNVPIEYEGDSKYSSFYITKSLDVTLKQSIITLNIKNILTGSSIVIKPIVTQGASGNLKIYVDNVLKTTIAIGSSYTITTPSIGKHDVRVVYAGDSYHQANETKTTFRVFTFYPIEVQNTAIIHGNDNHFQAIFYDEYGNVAANKIVSFRVNGEDTVVTTDANGLAIFNKDLPIGIYDVTVINAYVNEENNYQLKVFTSIESTDMTRVYNTGMDFKVKLLDENGDTLSKGYALFKVNDKDYPVVADNNGVAILNANLPVGTYTVTTTNGRTGETKTNRITIVSSVNANDMIRGYNSGIDFMAQFLDADAKPLINQKAAFIINNIQYEVNTDSNGYGVLNKQLDVDDYEVTIVNKVTGERLVKSLSIVGRIVENNDVIRIYGEESYYTLRIVGDDGNFVSANEVVNININNVDYQIRTNANGYASFRIDENIGYYGIFAEYKGYGVYNNVYVLQKVNYISRLDVANVDYKQNALINMLLSSFNSNAFVEFEVVGDTGYYETFNQVASSSMTLPISGLNASKYTVTAKYYDLNNYKFSTSSKSFNVNKINPKIIVVVENANVGENAKITINIPDVSGNVVTKVGDNLIYEDYLVKDGVIIKEINSLPAGVYNVDVTYKGDNNYNMFTQSTSLTIIQPKVLTNIIASDVTITYGKQTYLVATLKDQSGHILTGKGVSVFLNGINSILSTDNNGQFKVLIKGLAPKTYTVSITFAGDTNYVKSVVYPKVTVTKATPKLTALKKTFKRTVKVKNYVVALKTNQNKVMKNTWVTLTINKKIFKAKTNAKGQAIFKITNLKKKGNFIATVKYVGNAYYNSKLVKQWILVR